MIKASAPSLRTWPAIRPGGRDQEALPRCLHPSRPPCPAEHRRPICHLPVKDHSLLQRSPKLSTKEPGSSSSGRSLLTFQGLQGTFSGLFAFFSLLGAPHPSSPPLTVMHQLLLSHAATSPEVWHLPLRVMNFKLFLASGTGFLPVFPAS